MGAATKQAMFDRAVTAHREQAADERTAGLPVGALGADALYDLAGDEGITDSDFVRKVADALGLSILGAVNRMELIDFDTARKLAEAN
jgi:hypothetical protein